MKVDYLKLSEQYAGFLIAIGGVSITVLALVLSFDFKKNTFVVAALTVATISCFTGAHMMAETAAFINSLPKEIPPTALGERLFLLASINTFIAIILVIFALVLLPKVSGKVNTIDINLISICGFAFVIIAALSWMFLSVERMPSTQGYYPILITTLVSIVLGFILFHCISKDALLNFAFIPIIVFILISLLRFAWTINDGGKVNNTDIWIFSAAITFTCASIVVAGIQSLCYE